MNVHIEVLGDRSVGIFPSQIDVAWPSLECLRNAYDQLDEREGIRKALKEFFEGQEAFTCIVRFEDECVECGRIGCERKHYQEEVEHE